MEVLSIKDNPDGSADVECLFQEDEVQMLLGFAVNTILKDYIEKMKRKCFDCGVEIGVETIEQFPDTEICAECMKQEKE